MRSSATVRATWLIGATPNYRAAALVRAGDVSEATAEVCATLQRLAGGASVQSTANTVRNAVALLDRLGHPDRAALLVGWLAANLVGIPGTPGMRRHVEEMAERLPDLLSAEAAEALADGARLTVAEVVHQAHRALTGLH